jgi:hypothetical protein
VAMVVYALVGWAIAALIENTARTASNRPLTQ